MIKEIIICDVCNEELPKVKKKDILGVEREYYRVGKIEIDNLKMDLSRTFNVHLCERCAANINLDLMKRKMEILMDR